MPQKTVPLSALEPIEGEDTKGQKLVPLSALEPVTASEIMRSGPVGRFMGGAARELGAPDSLAPRAMPPLDSGVEKKIATGEESLGGVAGPVASFLGGGTVRNIGGQAASGNYAGAAGAAAADVATYGIPYVAGKISRIPKMFSRSAEEQYARVLAPTTEINKAKAQRVIPEALKRGVVAGSLEGLKEKVGTNVKESLAELDRRWNKLPPGTRMDSRPILAVIDKAIDKTYLKGTRIVEDEALKQEYEIIKSKIGQMADAAGTISVETARDWRQHMDEFVTDHKGFYVDKPQIAESKAKRLTANAVRNQLAKENPSIAEANADFNFWKNYQEILKATNERRTGQSTGLRRAVMIGAGAAAGLASPGEGYYERGKNALIDASLMGLANRAFNSTAWRTVSAVTKDRLATALVNGNVATASVILKQIVQGTSESVKKHFTLAEQTLPPPK